MPSYLIGSIMGELKFLVKIGNAKLATGCIFCGKYFNCYILDLRLDSTKTRLGNNSLQLLQHQPLTTSFEGILTKASFCSAYCV